MTTAETPSESSESPSNTVGNALELQSEIRCARCGYSLQGVSVRSACSECGLPVKTTILAIVDPHAAELAPLERPKFTAFGMLLWTHGLFAGFGFMFALQLFGGALSRGMEYRAIRGCGIVLITLCAIGSVALVRPHRGLKLQHRINASIGFVGFLVSISLAWIASDPYRVMSLRDFHDSPSQSASFYGWLAAFHLTIAVSVLLVRANARVLAARSLLMRSGFVNRQTLAATACVLVIAGFGQTMMFADARTSVERLWSTVGVAISMTSGILLQLAGFGLVIDSWRLFRVLLEPPVKLESLLGKGGRT